MKVLRTIDPFNWSNDYKCIYCDSLLEVKIGDIIYTPPKQDKECFNVSFNFIEPHISEIFSFECPICIKKVKIAGINLPKRVVQQLRYDVFSKIK